MEQLDFLLFEYTEILLGNRKNYTDDYFEGNKATNEALAIAFIREVAHVYLQCDNLESAQAILNDRVFKKMKLDKILAYIIVPSYVDSADSTDYMISKIFSDRFNEEEWIATRYCQRILQGTIAKFPKNYMQDDLGMQRACFCLRYFLTREFPSATSFELYRFASGSEFRAWIKKHCLSNTCSRLFATPIDYLDQALPNSMRNSILRLLYRSVYYMSFTSSEILPQYRELSLPPKR